jgi:hypothetical protein
MMSNNFSKKERQFIFNMLDGQGDKYSSSYASRLRNRCLCKAVLMLEEIILFNKLYLKEYQKWHRFYFHNQDLDTYIGLLKKIQDLPSYPWQEKK